MNFETNVRFAQNHPSFDGHFPGQPIVAGVLILDQVRMALTQWQPTAIIESLPQIKFTAPLLPEQELRIQLESDGDNKYRFRCYHEQQLIAQGALRTQST